MTEQTLVRPRAGDEDAFRELTDPYRRQLQLHVYRIAFACSDWERGASRHSEASLPWWR